MSLLRALATVGGLTVVSRVAGFARDLTAAALLGAGAEADAFFAAMRLPDLARRLFAEGALSTAFVPRFTALLTAEGRGAALAFAERVLAVLVAALVVLIVVAELVMPWLVDVIAPGASDADDLILTLARLTFPYVLPVSVVALLGGVLNGLGRVAAFAAAPILFNLTLITALWGAHVFGAPPVITLAAAVSVAGVIQMIWMVLALRHAGGRESPIGLRWVRPRLSPDVRALFRRVGPGALATGAGQINLTVDVILASLLPVGAVSALSYADRLAQLPLGLIGLSVGMAVLPRLSALAVADQGDDVGVAFRQGVLATLALGLPAAVGLGVASGPVVEVLFLRGAFTAEDAALTAGVLTAYAAGLPAAAAIKPLNALFFARGDTVTPMRAAVAVAVANVGLSLALMPVLGAVGIALATSLCAWLNLPLLLMGLSRRGGAVSVLAGLGWPTFGLSLAALVMGLATHWLVGAAPSGALGLAVIIAGAGVAYAAMVGGLSLCRLDRRRADRP